VKSRLWYWGRLREGRWLDLPSELTVDKFNSTKLGWDQFSIAHGQLVYDANGFFLQGNQNSHILILLKGTTKRWPNPFPNQRLDFLPGVHIEKYG
jgi:hypothetical protein